MADVLNFSAIEPSRKSEKSYDLTILVSSGTPCGRIDRRDLCIGRPSRHRPERTCIDGGLSLMCMQDVNCWSTHRRGRGPYHAQKDRVGTWDIS